MLAHLSEVLEEIHYFQQLIAQSRTKHFDYLLLKIVGTDTIPVVLLTKQGTPLRLTDYDAAFTTCYFRIEKIAPKRGLLTVSFLRPVMIEGELATLEKVNKRATIHIDTLSGVQLLSTSLLSANVFIESKW